MQHLGVKIHQLDLTFTFLCGIVDVWGTFGGTLCLRNFFSCVFYLWPASSTITHNLELPNGEYVFSAYQDTNFNGKLDKNIFGIPKEPSGWKI